MAVGDVNAQTVIIDTGDLTLFGSPTGSGVYRVETEAGAASDAITSITGGSGHAVITLSPATDGQWFTLVHDGATIFLAEDLDFVSAHIRDRITLVDADGTGAVWVELARSQFVPV